jgi:hypothetical protein
MASALLTDETEVTEGTGVSVKGPATVSVSGTLGTGLILLQSRYGTDNFAPIDDTKVIDRLGSYAVNMVGTFDIRADLIRVDSTTEVTVSVQGS